MVGKGDKINIWNDNWCGHSIALLLQIPTGNQQFLKANLKEIMHGMRIVIPSALAQLRPTLPHLASKVHFNIQKEDSIIWMRSDNNVLSFKDAYSFLNGFIPACNWGRMIWFSFILPSKSLLFWPLMYGKLPIDDILALRGLYLPSICSLCNKQEESISHIFFNYIYANSVWMWLWSRIDFHISCLDDC